MFSFPFTFIPFLSYHPARWVEKVLGTGHLSPRGLHEGGPGGRAPLLWTPKDMLSKALEWASVSIGAPLLGNMGGRSYLRAFEIKRYIKRYVKIPCKRVSLSMRAPLGNLEGKPLPGLSERKGKYIWVSFLDPEDIKILSLGAIWNFGKGTGLSWDTMGPSIRSRCIGTVKARTQC
jgi:hypothetical protein